MSGPPPTVQDIAAGRARTRNRSLLDQFLIDTGRGTTLPGARTDFFTRTGEGPHRAMPRPTKPRPSSSSEPPRGPAHLTRRELFAAAGAGGAALVIDRGGLTAGAPSRTDGTQQGGTVVFTHTTVVNADTVQHDVALAVEDDRIAAIGPTDTILEQYPGAEVYDGRGKALLPGLINCHAHMAAVIARGFNEDFGFPNTADLEISPRSLLQEGESELMVQVAALEAITTGTTTIVENTGNIHRHAAALAESGLRCVFAESGRVDISAIRVELP